MKTRPLSIFKRVVELGISDIPIAVDDPLKYVKLAIEVYSGVFIDENKGDTVHVITSPLSG